MKYHFLKGLLLTIIILMLVNISSGKEKVKGEYMNKEEISETIYLFEKWLNCENFSDYTKISRILWGVNYEADSLIGYIKCLGEHPNRLNFPPSSGQNSSFFKVYNYFSV